MEVLSEIAFAVKDIMSTTHIVDIGDGKGYLSSMLALHYRVPVLGIDASHVNTDGAVKRVTKLQKVWPSLTPTYENSGSLSKVEVAILSSLYKQVTQYVDEKTNLSELVSGIFTENNLKKISLVGLHTCGNLAPTCIKIFSQNPDIRSICNVGCCYHLLTEDLEIHRDEFLKQNTNGFPMSEYLKMKKVVLGRSARMIASQSVDRILDKKELPHVSIFYRALLQVLLEKHCDILPENQVGRTKKGCTDFVEYVNASLKKLKLNLTISESEIKELFNTYQDRRNELNVFYLIRAQLSSVIESLILLDRLLFLHEQGYSKSFLVQLFEPVISPRCYGLIGLK